MATSSFIDYAYDLLPDGAVIASPIPPSEQYPAVPFSYNGTEFDGSYDSPNTQALIDQQEAFDRSMEAAAMAGKYGDYSAQAGHLWDAYSPGFAVLAQYGLLPRFLGYTLGASRAYNHLTGDDYLARWGGDMTHSEALAQARSEELARAAEQARINDEIAQSWIRSYGEPATPPSVPSYTSEPVQTAAPRQLNQDWLDSYLGMMDRVTNNTAQQPTRTIIPRSDRFVTRYPRRPGLMSAEEAEQIQRAARLYPDL